MYHLSLLPTTDYRFNIFALILLLSVFVGVALESVYPLLVPAVLLSGYWILIDFRHLFFILLACLPLSTEVTFSNGFSTDLPAEPFMVLLMSIYALYVLKNIRTTRTDFLLHPISLILLLHLGWILTTAISSQNVLVSIKFFLAKTWYVMVFYFMAAALLDSEKQVRRAVWFVCLPLIFTVATIVIRHAEYGFTFKDINHVLSPFYRNHVNYASILALFVPFIWLAMGWYARWSSKWIFLLCSMILLLVAIQFAYTRAAYVAIVLAIGAYFVIRWRLMRVALSLLSVGVVSLVIFLGVNNNYLNFAPDFNKTITHEKFDNLLEATYKMEDISTMERVYRWVAGSQMSKEHPLMGFGPGNFYNFYKSYTVTSFRTYVSDNPEHSGIHCYYFMTLVEQGYIGMLLFIALNFFALLHGEKVYHRTLDPDRRRTLMAVMLCLLIIDSLLLINDMVETDKVGTFFFLCLALIAKIDVINKRDKQLLVSSD